MLEWTPGLRLASCSDAHGPAPLITVVMPSEVYSHVDAIRLSPGGSELWIDYCDWHDQHETIHIRYIVGSEGSPRLITEGGERQIAVEDIPQQVIREARAWLKSTAEAVRSQRRQELADMLAVLLIKLGELRA